MLIETVRPESVGTTVREARDYGGEIGVIPVTRLMSGGYGAADKQAARDVMSARMRHMTKIRVRCVSEMRVVNGKFALVELA